MAEIISPINYQLIQKDDIPAVIELMIKSGFPISGISSKSLYIALCNDAFTSNRMIIGVAKCENKVAAFLVIIVNWKAYWRQFLLHHPILGVKIIWQRFNKSKVSVDVWKTLPTNQQNYINSIISNTPSGRTWSDSSENIAKAVFLQVDPAFRKKGLAVSLYKYIFDILPLRNISRCDAKVDIVNAKALPLHVVINYRLERSGNSLFATIDLPDIQGDNN